MNNKTANDEVVELEVGEAASRLDQYLARCLPDISRAKLQKFIRQGQVQITSAAGQTITETKVKAGLASGDTVVVQLPPSKSEAILAEDIPLDVLFEDQEIILINKPAGLVVHPAQGHSTGTLVNALLARYPDLVTMQNADEGSQTRPGIVHRLDRDTSGLILVARTPTALQQLRQQFKDRSVKKSYLALAFGCPEAQEGVIDVPLGRDLRHRQKMAPRADGKMARTHYRLVEDFGQYSLLEIGLETGRTHQIRVHLAWLKCPVVGDTIYGRKKNKLGLKRQFLHAWKLSFIHPTQGTPADFEAPLPPDLTSILTQLQGKA